MLTNIISNPIKVFGGRKIFCIGLNKTGTTSLKVEMQQLGYIVGNQRTFELLFDDWVKRDFRRVIRYCNTAQFFQDVPFSLPYTYIVLDHAFPGSKFILTVRDDAEQWYTSLTRFHSRLWGDEKSPPNSKDLKKADYIYKGFPFHSRMHVNNVTEEAPYNKDVLMDYYEIHNKNVKDYFRFRSDDLLLINLRVENSYQQFCKFLKIKQTKNQFPWENKN